MNPLNETIYEDRQLSPEVINHVRYFLEDFPVNRIGQNLRRILMSYFKNNHHGMFTDIEDIIADMDSLFDLLDVLSMDSKLFKG